MIKSEIVRIKKIKNFDDSYIENELNKLYKSVIRWAVIDINNYIEVSVSYLDSK